MGTKINREKRFVSFAPPGADTAKRLDSNFYVEGYAATFTRYLLWEYSYDDGKVFRYYEEIAPDAFKGAEMSDVIMQYDHTGRVLARQRNGTLGVEADENGLFMFADLSKSAAAKELYNDIAEGLVDRMSWAFTIAKQEYEEPYEHTYLRRILQIKRVYDVSAVSIPANDDTEISARSHVEKIFEAEQRKQQELKARLLKLKINLEV